MASNLVSLELWVRDIFLVIYTSLGVYSIVLTARVILGKADLTSEKTASSKNALACAVLVGAQALCITAYCFSARKYSLLWAPGLLYSFLLPYVAALIKARQLSKR
jgi:hypothetical protein